MVWAGRIRHRRQAHRFAVRIEAAYGRGSELPNVPATVVDLNPFGLSMEAAGSLEEGEPLRMTLLLNPVPLEATGTVARVEPGGAGHPERAGVRFQALPQGAQDAIMRWCFSQPFGPGYPLRSVESEPVPEPARELATARRA